MVLSGILIVIVTLSIVFQSFHKSEKESPLPIEIKDQLPTDIPEVIISKKPIAQLQYSPAYITSAYKIAKENNPNVEKYQMIAIFANDLPIKKDNYSVEYDYDKEIFVLTINKDTVTEGNTAFDTLLNSYHILDRSWIQNLQVVYK